MSFYTAPPQFLADNPAWVARYQAEADALAAAEARNGAAQAAAHAARKAAIDARAARLAGKKADPDATHQERIAAAEARANLTDKGMDAAAQQFYRAWTADSATLARLSRAELAHCVEAGREALTKYETAYANFEFAAQRINADDAVPALTRAAVLDGGIRRLNDAYKVADGLGYLRASTEALASFLELLDRQPPAAK